MFSEYFFFNIKHIHFFHDPFLCTSQFGGFGFFFGGVGVEVNISLNLGWPVQVEICCFISLVLSIGLIHNIWHTSLCWGGPSNSWGFIILYLKSLFKPWTLQCILLCYPLLSPPLPTLTHLQMWSAWCQCSLPSSTPKNCQVYLPGFPSAPSPHTIHFTKPLWS